MRDEVLSLPQQVAEYIRYQIIHDILKPGERIRERHIAETLNVSRTPLRDALQILAMERLVELHPNRGATIVDPDTQELSHMLTVYSELEVLAGRLAARHATEADILRLEQCSVEMDFAFKRGDRARYFAANQGFHLAIIKASHNPVLIEMHGHLNIRLYRIRYLAVMNASEWKVAASEHGSLLEALRNRDGDLLAELQTKHLNFAWRLIQAAESTRPAPANRLLERQDD
ncbi:GntR family transcriptional regulator [Chelativorans sp. Marseille-P2723]|uniref:GntR family transcriptional regulator n=1 Tax=Chelativorans sp. Marseille-P2723 TaxID=2709133 RepID=UPI0015705CAE|nr:GntR family transcriptional regulator [Chelativorans sp. Marseille-P2723]